MHASKLGGPTVSVCPELWEVSLGTDTDFLTWQKRTSQLYMKSHEERRAETDAGESAHVS